MTTRLAGVAMIVYGVLYAILTPPFAVPDETGHWLHAVAASRQLDAWRPAQTVRVSKPAIDFLDAYAPAGDPRRITKRPRFAIRESPRKVTLHLGTASAYSALPYVFSIAGIWVANLLHLGTPASFWCGRLANMLLCSAIIIAALRRWKGGQAWIALVALTPMAVTLRSSYSADALVISLAILLAALVATSSGASVRDGWMAVAAAAVIVAVKPPYLPLALTALLVVAGRRGRRGAVVWSAAALVAIAVGATIVAHQASAAAPPDTGAARQARQVAAHPLRTAAVITADLGNHGWEYTREAIGVLGWLDIPLPRGVYLATLIAAAVVLMTARSALAWPARALIACAVVASLVAIVLALYIAWSPVGSHTVAGVQGRYLLPLFPLLAAVPGIGNRLRIDEQVVLGGVIIVSAVTLAIGLHAVTGHYVTAIR